ncbi:MAG: NUDIX hydrolase [bacterium]
MALHKWKIVKNENISPSRWYPLERHTVELPDGRQVEDYIVSHLDDIVMVVPILTSGEVVLVRQYKHGIREIMIELPAGFIQAKKSILGSAVAELHEETGIQVAESQLIPLGKIAASPGKSLQVVHVYLATQLEFNSTQHLDPNESIEVVTVSCEKLDEMIESGQIWASVTISALHLAKLKYPSLFAV